MIEREITSVFKKAVATHPVVTVFGPRQSGKTTLVRHVLPHYGYANLENPKERRLAIEDPEAFFALHPAPLIIDEVQRVPELLSWIQVRVDDSGRKGEYVVTGSHQPLLREKVSQSLAGRTAIITLLPFSLSELSTAGIRLSRDAAIYQGFLPRVYSDGLDPTTANEEYYRTYVERDVRQLVQVENQNAFEVFVRLLAGRIGQVVNFQSLSGDVGVDAKTLKRWMSVLEASYVVVHLQPYYRNFGKRLVKSPKVYFTDVGLASYLLGISQESQVARDPLFGGLFENMVVLELMKARHNLQIRQDFYYFRDNGGIEVDLVAERNRKLNLIEIKGAMTPDNSFGGNMEKLCKCTDDVLSRNVIYSGEEWPLKGGGRFVNFIDAARLLRNLDGKERGKAGDDRSADGRDGRKSS